MGQVKTTGVLAAMALLSLVAGCASTSSTDSIRPADVSYAQGAIALDQGDTTAAETHLKDAIQQDPDLIMARSLLGGIFRDRQDYSAAAEQYQRVVELDPYVYINHYNLALMQHLIDRLQEAATCYLKALELEPDDLKSNMNLAVVYLALGRPRLGLPYAQKATQVDTTSADAFGNYGVLLDAVRDYPAAERAYRRSLELGANRPQTIANLATNLSAQKKYHESVNLYEQVLKEQDSLRLRELYGMALLRDGRENDAARQFAAVLKRDPDSPQALNGLGEALLAQYRRGASLDEAKLADALKCWKRSLAINPDQPRIDQFVKQYQSGSLFEP